MTAMSKLSKATLPKTKGKILSSYELSNISWFSSSASRLEGVVSRVFALLRHADFA